MNLKYFVMLFLLCCEKALNLNMFHQGSMSMSFDVLKRINQRFIYKSRVSLLHNNTDL